MKAFLALLPQLVHSIRARLVLWFALILAVVLTLFSVIVYFSQAHDLRSEMVGRLEGRTFTAASRRGKFLWLPLDDGDSALIAHLGMRVDHRKISVTTSLDPRRPKDGRGEGAVAAGSAPAAAAVPAAAAPAPVSTPSSAAAAAATSAVGGATPTAFQPAVGAEKALRRPFYFEDVEVRRSRATGITCRVTLSKGEKSFIGEAEGMENERSRIELAARAALRAIVEGEPGVRPLDLGGAKLIEAFDREFVFVGVTVQQARTSVLLTGSCEVKDSPETASVLAVLDATNRWLSRATAGA